MITPQLALVRPRVICPSSGDALPVESLVGELLGDDRRVIQLTGGAGSGKTTALAHLAASLAGRGIVFLDSAEPGDVLSATLGRRVICANRKPLDAIKPLVLELAEWSSDDLIEYLLAAHRPLCASVMARVGKFDEPWRLKGNPGLWRLVLDELAADESLASLHSPVERILARILGTPDERRLAGQWSLAILLRDDQAALEVLGRLALRSEDFERLRTLRHSYPQRILAAEFVANRLRAGDLEVLDRPLPQPLVTEIAAHASADAPLRQVLEVAVRDGPRECQAMAASILQATDTSWRPAAGTNPCLAGGFFQRVAWANVRLGGHRTKRTDLSNADLTAADLSGAELDHLHAQGTCFSRSVLINASLSSAFAWQGDFSGADLRDIRGDKMTLCWANLRAARLDRASLEGVDFDNADLCEASLRGANLSSATFLGAKIDGADFTDANLQAATLRGLTLRTAILSGASLREANLQKCDLEGIALVHACLFQADLEGAWLTGSVLPDADLRGADLRDSGLADIQWENADLRGADLRGCTFHMGSTRSGLVGSPYPGHGSKTGFYTDDYFDQGYKVPEEIRKANLCGADLRGAKLDDVDFYLVDLRGAKLDGHMIPVLRQCGAILAARS